MEKKVSYPCIFDNAKSCEVKNVFKLVPESLLEFCKLCNQKPEFGLKLTEMAQTERIADKRLNFEMMKYEEEKESSKEIHRIISEALKGPIGKAVENLGSAVADRLQATHRRLSPKQTITCPGCSKPFKIVAGTPQVVCPHCSSILGLVEEKTYKETPSADKRT